MAVPDRRLSANFWLHEFPGWNRPETTEADVARLRETVARVLQPIRNAMGTDVIPTSWTHWSSGAARTGSHAHGGTVDFVVADGRTFEAFEWGARHLAPTGYVGRWIYEPERSAAEGQRQGEHIHMAPVEAMVEHVGDPSIQVLVEREEGRYEFFRTAATWTAATLAMVGAWLWLASRPRTATS